MAKNKHTDLFPIFKLVIAMQGCRCGTLVEPDNYGFQNMRDKCGQGYSDGESLVKDMLNELGVSELTLDMEIVADKAFELYQEFSTLVSDASPVLQAETHEIFDRIEDSELVYFGDIVARIKPEWLEEEV